MRILYVTTVGCTMSFFKAFIRELLEQGHQVDLPQIMRRKLSPNALHSGAAGYMPYPVPARPSLPVICIRSAS